ncbi:FG-GAP repeat domain-containing protein, partial [Longispora fulva]
LFNAWEADHVHYSYYAFGATPVHFVPRASINDAQIDGHPNGDYKAYRYRNITGSQTAASASPMFADLDGDGRAEMIVASPNGNVTAYRNVSTSGLWAAGFYTGSDYMVVAGVGSNYDKLRFADLDKDGRAEMIIAQADGSVVAYRNINTSGLWAAGFFTGVDYMTVAGVGSNYDKVRFADLDKDGRAEMIIAQADGSVVAYRNINTTGLWAAGFFTGVDYMNVAGVGSNYDKVRFADLDKDGRAEMIIAQADGSLIAYRNINTTGLWAAGFFTGVDYMNVAGVGSNYDRVRFADLDKDGRAEMIIAAADGNVTAYRNINTTGLWAAGFYTGADYMVVATGVH